MVPTAPSKKRFSIKILFLITTLLFVGLIVWPRPTYEPYHPRETDLELAQGSGAVVLMHYATRRHRTDRKKDILDYVVIERVYDISDFASRCHTRSSTSEYHKWATLYLKGREVTLPSPEARFWQFDGDKLTTSNAKVGVPTFERFKKNFTAESTIDELVEMAREAEQH